MQREIHGNLLHPFHMDTFKPGRAQFHTFEVRNFDFVTGSNPVHSTQLWFDPVVTSSGC